MARIYANENMALEVVEILRGLNHDVLLRFCLSRGRIAWCL